MDIQEIVKEEEPREPPKPDIVFEAVKGEIRYCAKVQWDKYSKKYNYFSIHLESTKPHGWHIYFGGQPNPAFTDEVNKNLEEFVGKVKELVKAKQF